MVFVDQTYITIARKTEVTYHEQKVSQLERTIKQLTAALAWEHQQHCSRLMELEKVESHLTPLVKETEPQRTKPSTLKPLPGSKQKWSQTRKNHRHHSKNPALLQVS